MQTCGDSTRMSSRKPKLADVFEDEEKGANDKANVDEVVENSNKVERVKGKFRLNVEIVSYEDVEEKEKKIEFF